MGAFLLSQGDKRYCAPSARVMIHQPSGGFQGQATDWDIHNAEINRMKEFLTQQMADTSNVSYSEMRKLCERDYFIGAAQALELGIIDAIIPHKKVTVSKGKD